MKKITKILCGIAICATMCFAAAGCGPTDTDSSDTSIVTETTVETTETTTTETTTTEVTTTATTTTETTTSETTEETTETTTDFIGPTLPEATSGEIVALVETSKEEPKIVAEIERPVTTIATTLATTVSTTTATETKPIETEPVALKTNEEIAAEVWQGLWGSGADRKARLEAAGYNYEEVQAIVDKTRPVIQNGTPDNVDGYPMSYVKYFSRGTYYAYGCQKSGGSGRSLIDCSYGSGGVKGSIASSYLYRNYGYNYNGKRTMVYLEISGYPSMNGYYYLDDSDAGNSNVIDFYYTYNSNCPFQNQGVVGVDCYIVSY